MLLAGEKKQMERQLGAEVTFHVLHYREIALPFGEGNGTPLQYSCLEDPMDGGAW